MAWNDWAPNSGLNQYQIYKTSYPQQQPAQQGWSSDYKTNLMQSGADFGDYQNQLKSLLTDPSKIQETPVYQFAKQQGEQAINRSAAAKGGLNSGGVLAELARYGTGLASQEYGGQVNRLADLIRGAQQFGISSGQFRPTTYGTPVQTSNTQWATSYY